MLNVCCFLWQGDRWDADDTQLDGPIYVRRLARAVRRNLDLPHRFVVFTGPGVSFGVPGLMKYVEFRELSPPSWMGCLPKLWAFSRRSGFEEGDQVLSLDIDLVITGSLNDIGGYDGPFCVRSKFAPGQGYKADGDIVGFRVTSDIREQIWAPLLGAPRAAERETGGRERWWFRKKQACEDRWQDLFPGQVISYKRHVRTNRNELPANARIVSCHGRPRPHELEGLQWVRNNWR